MLRAFIATSIFILTVSAAQADPAIEVTFSDLDLSKPSDVTILEGRVQEAANKVCAPLLQSVRTSLDYQIWYNGCIRKASVETMRMVAARSGQYRAFAKN